MPRCVALRHMDAFGVPCAISLIALFAHVRASHCMSTYPPDHADHESPPEFQLSSLPPPQESELTPTGSNLLDGRFAVFGYVVDNATLLADLQVFFYMFLSNFCL